MNIHDRRTTQKLEKQTVALEKCRSEETKFFKLHNSISCRYFGIRTLVQPLCQKVRKSPLGKGPVRGKINRLADVRHHSLSTRKSGIFGPCPSTLPSNSQDSVNDPSTLPGRVLRSLRSALWMLVALVVGFENCRGDYVLVTHSHPHPTHESHCHPELPGVELPLLLSLSNSSEDSPLDLDPDQHSHLVEVDRDFPAIIANPKLLPTGPVFTRGNRTIGTAGDAECRPAEGPHRPPRPT